MHCRDVGMNCDFVARGKDEKEILEQAGRHAQRRTA
jgi:predicted small metal-binding protein